MMMLRIIMPMAILLLFCKRDDTGLPGRSFNKKNIQIANSPEKTIRFSGYEWKVRDITHTEGPGPNYFSEQSVWVDQKGVLHLYLHRDSLSGNWLCAEVTSTKSFGYGTYSFAMEGAVDKFDKNIVLGLFNYSGNDGYDEMDIEFARWGNASYPNLNYTVWPGQKGFKNSSYVKEYIQESNYSDHQFRRSRDSVIFLTFNEDVTGKKNLANTYNCVQPPASISNLQMPVHINLWLFDGHPPEDQKPVEILIHNFSFEK